MEQKLINERLRMELEGKDNKHKKQNIQRITATRAF
jgi:hypothetical protein